MTHVHELVDQLHQDKQNWCTSRNCFWVFLFSCEWLHWNTGLRGEQSIHHLIWLVLGHFLRWQGRPNLSPFLCFVTITSWSGPHLVRKGLLFQGHMIHHSHWNHQFSFFQLGGGWWQLMFETTGQTSFCGSMRWVLLLIGVFFFGPKKPPSYYWFELSFHVQHFNAGEQKENNVQVVNQKPN